MAAETESDYESDEEFQERISDELRTVYFPELFYLALELEHELNKKRFDRAEKIIEIMLDDHRYDPGEVSEFLHGLTKMVFRLLTAGEPGCSETLQFMFSNLGLAGYASDCAQKRMVVRQASRRRRDDSVCTPRVLAENSSTECFGSGLCCKLIGASACGNLETVEKCLALEEYNDQQMFCHHVDEFAACVAAQYGHTHIVEAFLIEWESRAQRYDKQTIHWLRNHMLYMLCLSSNFEMVVSILQAKNDAWNQEEVMVCSSSGLVRADVNCMIEFLRKVSVVMSENHDSDGDEMNSRWLEYLLMKAIELRILPHVEAVLDELDPNKSGKIFSDYTWLMDTVLRSRCASILRCVLVRYPEVFIRDVKSDPMVVINKYHWPTGARLLVEADAKCKGGVPAEHARILTLSLEERCRVAVRRSLKSPLSENVEKLPLPTNAKRRLLYQRS